MLWSDLEEFGKWLEPWRGLERDFGGLRRALERASAPAACDYPPVNVWTSADHAVVTTEIPGIDPGAVDVSVAEKTLTISGSRRPDETAEGESFHRRERRHGRFTKTIELPFTVDADKVTATVAKGVLSISLPRAEAEKPKKIGITLN